jgi:hypothetical protein
MVTPGSGNEQRPGTNEHSRKTNGHPYGTLPEATLRLANNAMHRSIVACPSDQR